MPNYNFVFKDGMGSGVVTHACNISYSEGSDWEDGGTGQPGQKC
jgi:hypothetical protein